MQTACLPPRPHQVALLLKACWEQIDVLKNAVAPEGKGAEQRRAHQHGVVRVVRSAAVVVCYILVLCCVSWWFAARSACPSSLHASLSLCACFFLRRRCPRPTPRSSERTHVIEHTSPNI